MTRNGPFFWLEKQGSFRLELFMKLNLCRILFFFLVLLNLSAARFAVGVEKSP